MTTKEEEKKIRARIKYWLEIHEISRKELSERLGVTESALNGWLSTKPLPPARWEEIQSIFKKYEEPERKRIVGTSLSDDEFSLMRDAAEKAGLSVDVFFRNCILQQIEKDLSGE